jgi:hypothetical protein
VRAEDKRTGIDKDEVESQQRRRQDRAQNHERNLEETDDLATHGEAEESAKRDRCAAMMSVVEAIFRKELRPLAGLTESSGFSAEELRALEFLEAAVKGRHRRRSEIVYAEDREDLLEQALAVLYPTLSHGMEKSAEALREQHDELVERVSLLREEIASKDDAQADPLEVRQKVAEAKGDGDQDDDEDDADADEASAEGEASGTGDASDDDDEDDAEPGDAGDPGVP